MLSKYDVEYSTEKYPSSFRIEKFRFKYVKKENGKILGEGTDFHYFGGPEADVIDGRENDSLDVFKLAV